jgi:uncharacterized protein (DUF1800 family)
MARATISTCIVAGVIGVSFVQVQAASGRPTLVSDASSTRAVALESVTQKSEPFSTTPTVEFGSDHHTRIMIFAFNLYKFADDGVDAYKVDAEDLNHHHYALPVEAAGPVPGFEGITQINVRLTDELGDVGDVLVGLTLHGITTNRVRIGIGHVGGGPLDDSGAGPTPAPQTPPPVNAPLDSYAGPASSADTVRMLEQAAFGPTRTELPRVQALGFRAYLNEQFATPVSGYPTALLYPSDDMVGCPGTGPNRDACLRDNYSMYPLQVRFFKNALSGNDQLRQRVSFALHQIFVASGRVVYEPSWMTGYLQTFDRNAFGNFRQLLSEITLNPAMGHYLNMVNNSQISPNENYAREVLQLFSVGPTLLNVDGSAQVDAQGKPVPTYDQVTITAFARVFTGWTFPAQKIWGIDNQTNVVNYIDPMVVTNNQNVHDMDSKTLLRGVVLPPGQTAQQDLNAAIDNIFNHPNVGPFIAKRLIRSLVTSNPTSAYVQRVAVTFNNNCAGLYPENPCSGERGSLKAVVRAMLLDPEARGDVKTDPDYGKLREPVLFMIELCRAISDNPAFPDGTYFPDQAPRLDQDLFRPSSVFGYFPSEYGVPGTALVGPEFGGLSVAATVTRINVAYSFLYRRRDIPFGGSSFSNGNTLYTLRFLADDPPQMAEVINTVMLHGTMTDALRQNLLQAVQGVPVVADAEYRWHRWAMALSIVSASPQYQIQR